MITTLLVKSLACHLNMYTHVVGATSSIGSAITARLEEDGHHVVTIGRSNSNNITWDVLNDAYIPDLAQFYPVSGFIFCLGPQLYNHEWFFIKG